jgi:hypothetical protein
MALNQEKTPDPFSNPRIIKISGSSGSLAILLFLTAISSAYFDLRRRSFPAVLSSLSRFSAAYLCYRFVEEGPVWLM